MTDELTKEAQMWQARSDRLGREIVTDPRMSNPARQRRDQAQHIADAIHTYQTMIPKP